MKLQETIETMKRYDSMPKKEKIELTRNCFETTDENMKLQLRDWQEKAKFKLREPRDMRVTGINQ